MFTSIGTHKQAMSELEKLIKLKSREQKEARINNLFSVPQLEDEQSDEQLQDIVIGEETEQAEQVMEITEDNHSETSPDEVSHEYIDGTNEPTDDSGTYDFSNSYF